MPFSHSMPSPMRYTSDDDYYEDRMKTPRVRPISERIAEALSSGEKVGDRGRLAAIQLYRNESGESLEKCRKFIDDIISGFTLTELAMRPNIVDEVAPVVPVPDNIETVQKTVLEKLAEPSGLVEAKKSVADILANANPDHINKYLGKLGSQLLAFVKKVDINHPSLADIQSGTLVEGGKVYRRVRETLALAEIAASKDFEFVEMPPVLARWFDRNHGRIGKVLQKPPARLLSKSGREKARRVFKYKNVDLSSIYEKGRSKTWDIVPDSFIPYCRMGPGFQQEITYQQKMAEHVSGLGMSYQANALASDMRQFESILSDQYNGFIRIKMYDAALIAAKAMGAVWDGHNNNKVMVNTQHFTDPFWHCSRSTKLAEDPYVSDVFDRHVQLDVHYQQSDGQDKMFTLQPRAYPLPLFTVRRPERVKKIIEAVESHADTGGYALFDNLWIIVPSVIGNNGHNDYFQFHDGKQAHKFYDLSEYSLALDRHLVESGQLFPVILGENTSKKRSYFISYWA